MFINPKKNTVKEENSTPEVYFLSISGELQKEDPIITDNMSYVSIIDHNKYGKIEKTNNSTKYFLKQYRGGRIGELLVDPYGMFSKAEDLSAFTTQRGHRFCEYIQVPENIFNIYLTYLTSRNPVYFRYCEREILNHVK